MSLSQQLERELQRRAASGAMGATQIDVQETSGERLEVDLASLDTMSAAVNELRLTLPTLQGCAFATIERWATELSKRISYLLEQIGPLEFDPQAGQALIRSTPPGQLPGGTVYYEISLKSSGGQTVTVSRFRAVAGQPGRHPTPMQLTHEVLVRLVHDLLDTAP